jgi:ATP/maltotriose-dependent transcriptional regulator MalT
LIHITDRGLEMTHLALETDTQFPQFRIHILAVLAQLHLRQGQLVEAQALIDKAHLDPKREEHPIWALYLPVVEAELAIQQENYDQALGIVEAFLPTPVSIRHTIISSPYTLLSRSDLVGQKSTGCCP